MVKETGRKSWIILTSAFLCIYLGGSLFYAIGVLHIALSNRYGQSVTMTAWLGSVFGSVFALAGPLASIVINRYSSRVCVVLGGFLNLVGFAASAYCEHFYVLFLTYGIIAGIGQCFSYTGSVIALGFYFEKHRTFATGIGVTGSGLATMTFSPLTQILLNIYGFEGSFLLLGAIGFQTTVFGALLQPHKREIERQKQISRQTKLEQQFSCRTLCKSVYESLLILQCRPFVFYLISILSWCISLAINILYLPEYFYLNGSSLVEASLMMSAMGFGSLISRILTGLAAVDGGIDPKILYFGCYGLLGIGTCLLPVFVFHYPGKLIYSVFLGLYSGGTWSILSSICVEIVGLNNIATAFGCVMFIAGVGFLIGPVIGRIMFILASIFGMVMTLFIPAKQKDANVDLVMEIDTEVDEQEKFLPQTDQ